MRAAARRPLAAGLIVAVLALVGAGFALRLHPTARTDTLVGRSSDAYQATTELHARFGDDPVIVLVRGDLRRTVLTDDLERIIGLEGCISGRVPKGVTPPGGWSGPCGRMAKLDPRPVKVVYGPGTFINESAGQIADAFNAHQDPEVRARPSRRPGGLQARALAGVLASSAPSSSGRRPARSSTPSSCATSFKLALQYKLTSIPQINDPNFVAGLVFENTDSPCKPKARFAYLFPTCNSALIQARLLPTLSDTQRTQAIALIRAGGADEGLAAEGRPAVRRDGRAGRRVRPVEHAGRAPSRRC